MHDLSHEELLKKYQESDPQAFDEFYRRTSTLIYNYLLSILRNQTDAQDALQDTFLNIHRSVASFDPQKNALAWVFTIARHAAFKRIKKRQPNLDEEITWQGITIEEQLEIRQHLQQLLDNLKESERLLIVERFINEKSFSDLADRLELTEQTVRQRISRLLRKIRNP